MRQFGFRRSRRVPPAVWVRPWRPPGHVVCKRSFSVIATGRARTAETERNRSFLRVVVLVDRALPGETLVARITASSRSHAEGRKLRTLQPPPAATAAEPQCAHFAQGCGGCTLQEMAYSQQLHHKASDNNKTCAEGSGARDREFACLSACMFTVCKQTNANKLMMRAGRAGEAASGARWRIRRRRPRAAAAGRARAVRLPEQDGIFSLAARMDNRTAAAAGRLGWRRGRAGCLGPPAAWRV